MVFLWVILYGLVYEAAGAAGKASWLLPAAMAAYTAAFLLWTRKSGNAQQIGLAKSTGISPAMLPLLVLPLGNLLANGFSFPGWEAAFVLICGSITEELFFRGFLFSYLLRRGPICAVLGSSLLFALMHFANLGSGAEVLDTLMQVLCAFWVGVCYCLAILRWKSLLPCIVAHSLTNLTAAESSPVFLPLICILICVCYSLWLKNQMKENVP